MGNNVGKKMEFLKGPSKSGKRLKIMPFSQDSSPSDSAPGKNTRLIPKNPFHPLKIQKPKKEKKGMRDVTVPFLAGPRSTPAMFRARFLHFFFIS